jgi:hypothetical protein
VIVRIILCLSNSVADVGNCLYAIDIDIVLSPTDFQILASTLGDLRISIGDEMTRLIRKKQFASPTFMKAREALGTLYEAEGRDSVARAVGWSLSGEREDWEKRNGLKRSTARACVSWLLGRPCRRVQSHRHLPHYPHEDRAMMYLRDGKPVVLVYDVNELANDDIRDLRRLAEDHHLRFQIRAAADYAGISVRVMIFREDTEHLE